MKTANKGFLLLELLLACVIAGLVISAAMQIYTKILMFEQKVNRKNDLIININRVKTQIFNDFNNAFIPAFDVKDPLAEKDLKPIFFQGGNDGSRAKGPDNSKYKSATFNMRLLNTAEVSFCSTNIMSFGHEAPRKACRVTYLVEKSSKSTASKDLFNLYRIETDKLWQSPSKKELEQVYKMLLIENLAECSIMFFQKPHTEERNTKDAEVVTRFDWGSNEEDKATLPGAVHFRAAIECFGRMWPIEIYVPIFAAGGEFKTAQPTKKLEDEKKDDKKTDALAAQEIPPELQDVLEKIPEGEANYSATNASDDGKNKPPKSLVNALTKAAKNIINKEQSPTGAVDAASVK